MAPSIAASILVVCCKSLYGGICDRCDWTARGAVDRAAAGRLVSQDKSIDMFLEILP